MKTSFFCDPQIILSPCRLKVTCLPKPARSYQNISITDQGLKRKLRRI